MAASGGRWRSRTAREVFGTVGSTARTVRELLVGARLGVRSIPAPPSAPFGSG
jgi:hypothetical protein